MTPIRTNKPVFFDVDDSVLEGGQIYIGQPSTDPRTNAKTVTLVDSGGSGFTASQPLKTKAGRIVYNGKPIEATVDGEYSMLILNSSGVQVDYSPSVNSEASADIDLSETIRVGLTLADIKTFDVSVGDVVRNVGDATATNYDGKDWLAVSATGSPGDDDTLIDFNNGLQGKEVTTYLRTDGPIAEDIKDGSFDPSGPTVVWTGSTSSGVPMSSLSESGPGMYVIVDDSNESYFVYVADLSINASSGLTHTGTISGREAFFRSGTEDFLGGQYSLDTGNNTGSLVLVKIYKV